MDQTDWFLFPTSDVWETETLSLPRAVGLRMEVQPHTPPGGDNRRRQYWATEPEVSILHRSQHEPVSQTTLWLHQVKVTETREKQ